MSSNIVECFNEETKEWEDIPLLMWASDFCFGFFHALNIFPPYEIAKRFSSDSNFAHKVMLGNKSIDWKPFELSKHNYEEIKEYFCKNFNLNYFELDITINEANDYIMWRREKKYRIPINVQEEFYRRFDEAVKKFKLLENDPDKYFLAWNELNKLIEEEQLLIDKYK